MKAHETYHVEALHLIACDIDDLVEIIIEIQKLRRIVLDVELLELYVCIELLDILFGSNVACFLKERALNRDSEESGFLDELVVDKRNAAALLGKDVDYLGL